MPDELYEQIQDAIEDKDQFNTVEEFVHYIVEQVLKNESTQTQSDQDKTDQDQKVKERLKGLGYLQ